MIRTNSDIFSLAGKTALVTGATGHLGRAISTALGQAGAHVIVNSRTAGDCEALAEKLLGAGLSAEPNSFDITCPEQVRMHLNAFSSSPLHIIINNAVSAGLGTIEDSTEQDYRDAYEVIVVSAHSLLRTLLPGLRRAVRETGDASIINISSMYGMVSPDQRIYSSRKVVNPPFYGAAKAALLQFTRYAACEFGHEGIRCNAVTPGPFPNLATQRGECLIEKLRRKTPMGRFGEPDEITGPIVFLASKAASFVNGANLSVDGGWTSW